MRYILGSASIFHPTWLDALAWTSFLYVAVRLLVRHEPRLWLLLGLIAGIGLEAKYTIGFLVLAFTAALILGGERRAGTGCSAGAMAAPLAGSPEPPRGRGTPRDRMAHPATLLREGFAVPRCHSQ